MTLIELQRQVNELISLHGDGEVQICVETDIHGQRMQIAGQLAELVPSIRYKKWVEVGVKYVLINEGFDE